MHSEEIEITILPGGRVEDTIKGVKGSACEDISKLLEQLGKVEAQERTGEYYEGEERANVSISEG